MSKQDNDLGVIRTISGALVDITAIDPDTISIADIAWGLGRQLRYNGHIKQDYTVAHHSVIMSYVVPEQFALEGLLHDAGEYLLGDIIYPVKQMIPAIETLESVLGAHIMRKFGDKRCRDAIWTIGDGKHQGYIKSNAVAEADTTLYFHECFSFGDRPGHYHQPTQAAWRTAVDEHVDLWGAPYYPFIHRYYELIGSTATRERINELVEPLWYGEREPYQTISDEIMEDINHTARELL